MPTTIDISDEAFQKHISEAILLMIGPESRDKLIAEALEKLCEKGLMRNDRGPDWETPSKMQYCLHEAVEKIAQAEMHRLVKEDAQITAAVEAFIRRAMLHVLDNDGFSDAVMDTFSAAIRDSLAPLIGSR